jgi:hypothetical protein
LFTPKTDIFLRVAFLDINVRGSLGTQIFELFTGLAHCIENHIEPDRVCINVSQVADHARVDYLSELFDLAFPVRITEGYKKVGFWSIPNVVLVHKHHEFIQSEYCKLKHRDCVSESKVLHLRAGDRQTLSDREYQLASEHEGRPAVLASHPDLAHSLFPENQMLDNGSAVGDWHAILKSEEVACSFSTFPLATLLFDSSKTVRMYFGREYQFQPGILKPLRAIEQLYPNVTFRDVHNCDQIDPAKLPLAPLGTS